MHIHKNYSWLKHIDFTIVDVLSLIISFRISYYVKFNHWNIIANNKEFINLLFLVVLLDIVVTLLVNPYSGVMRRNVFEEILKSMGLLMNNFAVACIVLYLVKVGSIFSRKMFVMTYALYFVLSIILKSIWKRLVIKGVFKMKTTRKIKLYVVASKDNLQKVLERCTEGEFQLYAVQGWCNESGLRYFADEVIEKGLDEVLIACNPRLVSSESYEKLITNHIDVHVSTEAIAGIEIGEQYHSKVGSLHTVSFGANEFTPEEVVYRGFKRIFDILCSLVGIILLVPLTIFIKVSYMLSGDFNSIFYTQKRIGLRGEEFNFYKYRSMVPNADEVLMKMLAENPEIAEEYNKNKKLEHDPRITKVGAFLRKTSLDEMPQFINVLKGDMTLIGNRPYLPREKDDMGRYFYDIEETQCGIVSYWAVNGRSELTFDERLKLEQYYSKNRSFAMDVLIFINALFVVLLKKGAQ